MSLQSDIADYRAEHAGMLHVTERFYRGLPFADAIRYGASAAGPYGKIEPHQRRIGVRRLRRSTEILVKRLPEIRKARSSADIFLITEAVTEEDLFYELLRFYTTHATRHIGNVIKSILC